MKRRIQRSWLQPPATKNRWLQWAQFVRRKQERTLSRSGIAMLLLARRWNGPSFKPRESSTFVALISPRIHLAFFSRSGKLHPTPPDYERPDGLPPFTREPPHQELRAEVHRAHHSIHVANVLSSIYATNSSREFRRDSTSDSCRRPDPDTPKSPSSHDFVKAV